jgi:hypothetical protein
MQNKNQEKLVNVIFPGAPKTGTTSVAAILNMHKEVFCPSLKEPRFFIADEIKNLKEGSRLKKYLQKTSVLEWEEYKQLYEGAIEKYKVDSSVQYLYYYKRSVPKIKEYLDDPYIFIILRDPIDRAISNFLFHKSEKNNSFIEVIKDEIEGKRDHLSSIYHYYKQGLYYEQVKYYLENFTKVRVLFYEDFKADKLLFINSILNTLQLDTFESIPDVPRLNTSSELSPVGKILYKKYSPYQLVNKLVFPLFLDKGKIKQLNLRLKANFKKASVNKLELNRGDYEFMHNLYKDDVQNTAKLLKQSVLPWSNFFRNEVENNVIYK